MIGLALLLGAAAVAFGLAKLLRLPAIPMLIVAGIVLALLGAVPPPETLQQTLVLGLAFLVFVAGMELEPRRLRSAGRAAVVVGLVQFAALAVVGGGVARVFGLGWQESLYAALALSASSTLVVVRVLQQRRQLFEPFARMVLGVLLLQDLLIIMLIPVLTFMGDGARRIAWGMAGTLALMLLAYAFLRWVSPRLIRALESDEEALLLTTLAILFVFAGLADLLGLPLVTGAFLGGLALAPFPVSAMVRGQLNSVSDFFLAIFFTALGAVVGLPEARHLAVAAALAAVVVLVTPPLVAWLAERSGFSARAAIESGLYLAQTSEFSLLLALQGLALGHIGSDLFRIIALVTVMTMILTPFLATGGVASRLMALHPLRRPGEEHAGPSPAGHVLLLGCGDNGMPLLETLLGSGYEVVVIEDDAAVVATLRDGGIRTVRGDASDPRALWEAGAREARLVISTIRRPLDNLPLIRDLRGVPAIVRVFAAGEAEQIRAAGGTPVLYSRAAADDFLHWLEQAEEVGLESERRQRPR
jgi:Kef-type K+ transport system membrane component KefB